MPAAGEAEEGGEGKVTEGTGLGEGDTTGAKDISNEVGAPLPACLPAYPVPAYPVYCQACWLTPPSAKRPKAEDRFKWSTGLCKFRCARQRPLTALLATHPPSAACLQLEDQDQMLGAKQKGAEEEQQQQDEEQQGPQEKQEQGAHAGLLPPLPPQIAWLDALPGWPHPTAYGQPALRSVLSRACCACCADLACSVLSCLQVWRWMMTLMELWMTCHKISSSRVCIHLRLRLHLLGW